MASKLPHLEDVERLSDRVIRILGMNPGSFTLQGTNTYLIGTGPKRILIDTAQGIPKWIETLRDVLRKESATIERVLVTHFHGDHLGGVRDVRTLTPCPVVHKNNHPEQPGLDLNLTDISDGERFAVEGATLRAVYSPGHSRDHMAFVLEEEDALFTGDCVLGHGTVVFENLMQYLRTLETLAAVARGRAYPGHGQLLEDGPARIREYIAHRTMREREVVAALAQGTAAQEGGGGGGLASMDLVRMIYKDTPENLHFAASRGVGQILEKLLAEGKVVHDEEQNTWLPVEKAVL